MEHKLIIAILQERAERGVYNRDDGGINNKKLLTDYYEMTEAPPSPNTIIINSLGK